MQESANMTVRSTILIADDCVSSVAILRCFLESLGYNVFAVTDGEAAIEAIRRSKPAIALIDLTLPNLSGLEVARAIRADTNLSAVRLIACTGLSGREHEEASRRAGFESHLVKPAELFEIERIIGRGD